MIKHETLNLDEQCPGHQRQPQDAALDERFTTASAAVPDRIGDLELVNGGEQPWTTSQLQLVRLVMSLDRGEREPAC